MKSETEPVLHKGESESTSSFIFSASIKERYCLNGPGAEKQTYHIVLDLKDSNIKYSVGDCLGIYPENDPHYVQKLLDCGAFTGHEEILNRKGKLTSLYAFLLKEANLNRVPKKLRFCESDFLHDQLSAKKIEPQALCDALSPMLPRFYSIASSQLVVGSEAHITVALSINPPPSPLSFGTCSHFLCCRVPERNPVISLFLQPSRHFTLPPETDDKPIIMIGPGTGVAPFRGFMQERLYRGASSKNWLFFGERRATTDYYYKQFWEELAQNEFLTINCAFSREQEDKVYVQHKMLQESSRLWEWLEEGAYLYVCGDATKMAKDVDKTLHQIIQNEGAMDPLAAKSYVKALKNANRYQRDVY